MGALRSDPPRRHHSLADEEPQEFLPPSSGRTQGLRRATEVSQSCHAAGQSRCISSQREVAPEWSPTVLVWLVVEQMLSLWSLCTSLLIVTIILVRPTITLTSIAAFPHRRVSQNRLRT